MTPQDILDSLQVVGYDNTFYIGTRKRGITIYKQQIRALNLIYSLQAVAKIGKDTKIAVIGGGVAAVTASAAALSIGCTVNLFESRSVLVHLQTGCKTRWVHPNIYDWPDVGSEFPYTRLPLLNWKAGYASDVSQQILDFYAEITKKHSDNYRECLGASFDHIDMSIRRFKAVSNNTDFPEFVVQYDYLVLATGFGLEISRRKGGSSKLVGTNSYWRNDDLDQPFLDESLRGSGRIVISGTGDGAMVDIFRACLNNFQHSRLIETIVGQCESPETLMNCLLDIKRAYYAESDKEDLWLYYRFNSMDANLLRSVKAFIDSQRRRDTEVYLIGREPMFETNLSLDKMSVFNAFIIYLLHNRRAFKYIPTSSSMLDNRRKILRYHSSGTGIATDSVLHFDIYVERHGPKVSIADSMSSFKIKNLDFNDGIDCSNRIWSGGWPVDKVVNKRYEFIPPILQAVATTFVEVLSGTILHFSKSKNPQFRLSFDRFIEINNKLFFQQVCRYAGTATSGSRRSIGRIFDHDHGIVGFTALVGRRTLFRKKSDFREALQFMHQMGGESYAQIGRCSSILCIPFLCKIDGVHHVTAALYVDSLDDNFFSNEIISLVTESCRGFVNNLERMIANGEFKVDLSHFGGVIPRSDLTLYEGESLLVGSQVNEKETEIVFEELSSLEFYE